MPATAAAKPVCDLLVGAPGQATEGPNGTSLPNDPYLNILSADIATNATELTVVFRLSALPTSATGDPYSPAGRQYEFVFHVGTSFAAVDAVLSPIGNQFAGGTGTGVVDTATAQLHVTVPLASLPVKIQPGTALTGLVATSSRWVGNSDTLGIDLGLADKVTSARTYIAGTPSCVPVGH